MKEERFYVRLTDEEQVAAFVQEFERNGLLKIKADLTTNEGKILKEIMIAKGHWQSFVDSEKESGHDPEWMLTILKKRLEM